LKSAFGKFSKLLSEFTFTDVRTAAAGVDWKKAPVVHL
jgi:hypothetical protein